LRLCWHERDDRFGLGLDLGLAGFGCRSRCRRPGNRRDRHGAPYWDLWGWWLGKEQDVGQIQGPDQDNTYAGKNQRSPKPATPVPDVRQHSDLGFAFERFRRYPFVLRFSLAEAERSHESSRVSIRSV